MMMTPTAARTIEVPVHGMDCAECASHVRGAIAALPGVETVDVLLSSEKAVVRCDPRRVQLADIRTAVEGAGYSVPAPDAATEGAAPAATTGAAFGRRVLALFGLVFGAVLFIVVAGEWLGLFERLTERVPFPV